MLAFLKDGAAFILVGLVGAACFAVAAKADALVIKTRKGDVSIIEHFPNAEICGKARDAVRWTAPNFSSAGTISTCKVEGGLMSCPAMNGGTLNNTIQGVTVTASDDVVFAQCVAP